MDLNAIADHAAAWPWARLWRHPKAKAAAGRCIGRTDVDVDARKARRLARAIHRWACMQELPPQRRVVWTSTLRRCRRVGRALRGLGWRHRVDARLCELDFGDWDGRAWDAIDRAAIQRWSNNLAHEPAGGGESVAALQARVLSFLQAHAASHRPLLVVGHGGWIVAARRWASGQGLPGCGADWPMPAAHGEAVNLPEPSLPWG